MAKHQVSPYWPHRFDAERFARNGHTPDPIGFRRIDEGFNFVASRQKKMVMAKYADLTNVHTAIAYPIYYWPTAFRTGEYTDSIVIKVGMVATDFGGSTAVPRLYYLVYPLGGGSLVTSDSLRLNSRASTAAVTPDGITHYSLRLTGLTSNTAYRLDNQAVEGARPVYMIVYENHRIYADDTVTGCCNAAGALADGDINDEDMLDRVSANNALWRHNGAPLLMWCCDFDSSTSGAGGRPPITSSTYQNIMSSSDSSHRFQIDTTYHSTRRRSGATAVPVELAVCARRASGTGTLDVRVYDGTNSVGVTGIGAGGPTVWTTTTGAFPAQNTTYQIQARTSDGTSNFEILGVYMWPYEA